MMDGIHAASSAPNVFPNIDNNDDDGQKNQEEVSNAQAEETSNVNSTEKAERNEEASDVQAKERDRAESAQSGREADATNAPAAQNEPPGTILDILG